MEVKSEVKKIEKVTPEMRKELKKKATEKVTVELLVDNNGVKKGETLTLSALAAESLVGQKKAKKAGAPKKAS